MSIRTRLLTWLLPTMIGFVSLISLFFYYNWYGAIIKSFRGNLKSIVVSTVENVKPDEIAWIKSHRSDPGIFDSPVYKKYLEIFTNINEDLPVSYMYIVDLEPVKKGERVLLDGANDRRNLVNDGADPELAFREVYLLDPSQDFEKDNKIGYGYSEPSVRDVYKNKTPFVTPIYKSRYSSDRYMSGYAPIIDASDNVIALVAADLNLDLFDKIHREALILIFFSVSATIMLVIFVIWAIATKISQPVRKLNTAALSLAAGDYNENIEVRGPKEISDLSNSLNTLRECLHENATNLRETSAARERLYGEYECSLLLQNRMLNQVLEDFHDPRFDIKRISYTASSSPHGVLLDILASTPAKTMMALRESDLEGFEGTYRLLRDDKGHSIRFEFDHATKILSFSNQNMPLPFAWSTQTSKMSPENASQIKLEPGDYFVLISNGLSKVLIHPKLMRDWFSKVFRHFAKEGPELLSAMLTSELNFLSKKSHIAYDIHILCIYYKG